MPRLDSLKYCFWRNRYAPEPVLVGTVFLDDAFGWTTQRLSPGVLSVFEEKLPGVLADAKPLGADELMARLAQQIQRLGDVTGSASGVVSRDDAKKISVLFFSFRDTYLAPRSLSLAVQVVERLTHPDIGPEHLARMLESCTGMVDAHGLERMTREMIEAAAQRGIPWFRPSPLVRHVQLGQGFRQQRFWNNLFGAESVFGRDYSRNKLLTFSILEQIRLPVGRFAPVMDADSALRIASEIGYPLVLKPLEGMKGDSVFPDLRDEEELKAALAAARVHQRSYLLQSFFPGDDHRLLIVSGKLVSAGRKIPASVVGDGRHNVAELVAIENRNPLRIAGESLMLIKLDGDSDRILSHQGLSRADIPDAGRVVRVKGLANIATGAKITDVTDIIHPDNASAAIRAVKAIGLTVGGVDFVCPDISKSWSETGGGICEVNCAVGLNPPDDTPHIDKRGKIIEAFFPPGDDGRIPTAMITGTKGKTTTTGMLASILSSAGHTVGHATTEGVTIGGERVAEGDLASVDGAAIVLRDATVTAAVLETARGGIVKTGLYLDRCDVAALINVEREQIGMNGIETLDDMAALKSKVLDVARKAVVLNADDSRCLALASRYAPTVRTFLFSRHAELPALREHIAQGGDALFIDRRDGHETIMTASGTTPAALLRTTELPVTRNGLFWQHACNAMAAAALALGLGVDLEAIRHGLQRYGREFRAASCRLALIDDFATRLLFDYAASPPEFEHTGAIIHKMAVAGRRICSATIAGDRPDWIFAESADTLVRYFDRFVFFERADYLRGRKPGEIPARMMQAMIAAGAAPDSISTVATYEDAARLIAGEAAEGDFVVAFASDSDSFIECYRAAFRAARSPT